jgi:glycosyltransferase involved in cell wall biosynthesis
LSGTEPPLITALVCTRNRGDSITATLASILAGTHPHFELIVVDQSVTDETECAVAPFLNDARLRYIRSQTQGVSRARNLGLQEARSEVVVLTDDDCVAPPHWLETMEEAFAAHPNVAVAFCNVDPAPYDRQAGFIPAYQRTGSKLLSNISEKCAARGIGAGSAVRREAVLSLGGFDEMLGPGADFPACEDGDMAVRALLCGYEVYETDAVALIHAGFRTWEQGRLLARRDWVGIGAAYTKPLKCGYWRFAVVPVYELLKFAVWPPISDVLHLHRPRGLGRIGAFFQGFSQGWRLSVDPQTLLFRAAK